MIAVFHIDPATLSSAQLKVMNFRTRRIITNPKVSRAMNAVKKAALPYAKEAASLCAHDDPRLLSVVFRFALPKSLTKKERARYYEGKPVTSARYGDLDNRVKAFIDALVLAGWMSDDRYISSLSVAKQYTLGEPRIDVTFMKDWCEDET